MATLIKMKHEHTGVVMDGYYGYSWTTFLFGAFPALFRGDFAVFGIFFLISIIVSIPTGGIGAWILSFIWAFMYNDNYTKRLLERGYKFDDTEENCKAAAAELGINLELCTSEKLEANSVGTTVINKIKNADNGFFKLPRDVTSGGYQLYLTRKFNIEKNATLEKYVVGEVLFGALEDALNYCDQKDKESEAAMFGIERNTTLEKYVLDDMVFQTIEEALSYSFKKAEEAEVKRIAEEEELKEMIRKEEERVVNKGQLGRRVIFDFKEYDDGKVVFILDGNVDRRFDSMGEAKSFLAKYHL